MVKVSHMANIKHYAGKKTPTLCLGSETLEIFMSEMRKIIVRPLRFLWDQPASDIDQTTQVLPTMPKTELTFILIFSFPQLLSHLATPPSMSHADNDINVNPCPHCMVTLCPSWAVHDSTPCVICSFLHPSFLTTWFKYLGPVMSCLSLFSRSCDF